MRSLLAPTAALAAALLSAAPLLADDPEGDRKAPDIRGSYTILSGAKFGEEVPLDRLKDNRVIVTADTFAVVDKDSQNLYASSYTLMPAKEGELKMKNVEDVWYADLVSTIPQKGSKAPALIRVRMKKPRADAPETKPEIAQLWIIYSLSEDRPTRFKTGPKDLMFRLKKSTDPVSVEEVSESDSQVVDDAADAE